MKVIGVVGMPASGKGEFAKIAKDLGIPVIVMGDVIRQEVRARGLEPTDDNFGAVATDLRAKKGMDAIAELCVPEIRKLTSPLAIIDGIRGDAEVRLFRKVFPGFRLIRIESSFGNRLSRIMTRGRSDDFQTGEELRNRDEREKTWGLGKALNLADTQIRNDGTLEEFAVSVRSLLDEIGRDP